MTIYVSQEQPFYKVGLYLPPPVFNHGQLCVALSRTRNELNLKVQIVDCEEQEKLLNSRHFTKKSGTERCTAVKIFAALTLSVTYIFFLNKHFTIIWIYFI